MSKRVASTVDPLTDAELNAIEASVKDDAIEREQVYALIDEVRRLQAILDGDPYQTARPDQRRAWRLSAIRYADKVEAELTTTLAHLDAIIAAYQNNEGLGPMLIAIREAKEWRGTVEQPAHQT